MFLMSKIKAEIIKYSKMLNSTKLSALRSGNISVRYKDGFLITPSGKKYSSLKNKDIVFVSLEGRYNKEKGIPSSEWQFHQDIYKNKKDAKAYKSPLAPIWKLGRPIAHNHKPLMSQDHRKTSFAIPL